MKRERADNRGKKLNEICAIHIYNHIYNHIATSIKSTKTKAFFFCLKTFLILHYNTLIFNKRFIVAKEV